MQSKLSRVVGLVSVAVAVLVVLAPGCSRDDRAAPPAVDLNCSFAARCVGPTETSVARCSAVYPAVNPCCPIVHPVLVWACEPGTGKCLVFGDGCLPAGWKASPLDASPPQDRNPGELGALAGCTHDDAAACWSCGSCAPASVASVGCTAPGACQLFCTSCMPAAFKPCSYGGPTEAAAECRGWVAPRGSLAGCKEIGGLDGGQRYCCSFCPTATKQETTAKNAQGQCYHFCSSCIPAELTQTTGCN